MRPRLLLLPDRPNWAFDFVVRSLERQLSKRFDISVRYSAYKPHVEARRYDLVHAFAWADPWPRTLKVDARRFIVEVASCRWKEPPYCIDGRTFADRYLSDCVAATTPSAVIRDELRDYFPAIILTPNGYEPSIFHPGPAPQGPLKICWVGQPTDPCKGLKEILLPACQKRFSLTWTDGSMSRAEVARLYRESDVVAIASTYESQPLPLIEGMASGCFPVATLVGLVPALVRQLENGLIVARSVDAFQDAFLWCENHLSRLREQRLAIADAMLRTRSWARCARYYGAIYDKLIYENNDSAILDAQGDQLPDAAGDDCAYSWADSIYWRITDAISQLRDHRRSVTRRFQ